MRSLSLLTILICLGSSYSWGHAGKDHGHSENPHDAIEGCGEFCLPKDPMYCDLNEDGSNFDESGNPDPLEVDSSNLCNESLGETEGLFANNPIASLGLKKGQLILTIDDGPNENVTGPILNLLDAYNIKAAFFVTGNRIRNHQNLIRRIYDEGHLVGNHTYSHDLKKIKTSTIRGEILSAHQELVDAIGGEPETRLLFRAPGLAWSLGKATELNNFEDTRDFIGPIHANLGTDAPRADWSCWSKKVSSQTCANWYFQDIVNTGRGIVLAHDVYYRAGHGNTYEMLRILLEKLDANGGIKNKNGHGVWEFVSLETNEQLNKYDTSPNRQSIGRPVDSSTLQITNGNVFVRGALLEQIGGLNDASKIRGANGAFVKAEALTEVKDLGSPITIQNSLMRRVEIVQTKPGYENLIGMQVFIGDVAF